MKTLRIRKFGVRSGFTSYVTDATCAWCAAAGALIHWPADDDEHVVFLEDDTGAVYRVSGFSEPSPWAGSESRRQLFLECEPTTAARARAEIAAAAPQ